MTFRKVFGDGGDVVVNHVYPQFVRVITLGHKEIARTETKATKKEEEVVERERKRETSTTRMTTNGWFTMPAMGVITMDNRSREQHDEGKPLDWSQVIKKPQPDIPVKWVISSSYSGSDSIETYAHVEFTSSGIHNPEGWITSYRFPEDIKALSEGREFMVSAVEIHPYDEKYMIFIKDLEGKSVIILHIPKAENFVVKFLK